MQKKEPSLAAYTNAFYTKPRKYTLFDFLRFGFHFSPLLATLRGAEAADAVARAIQYRDGRNG